MNEQEKRKNSKQKNDQTNFIRGLISRHKIVFMVIIIIIGGYFNSTSTKKVQKKENTIEESLAVIDSYKHSPKQFQLIINNINDFYPQLSRSIIADYIAYAYSKIQEKKPNVSLFRVATDIEEMVKVKGNNVIMEISTLVGTYIFLETTE